MTFPMLIALDGAILMFVWQLWKWAGRRYLAVYALQVILLGVGIWATDTRSPVTTAPVWLAALLQNGLYVVIPATAIVAAARLVDFSLPPPAQTVDWRKSLATLPLIALLVFLAGYQVMLASIWDVATDGLNGLFLLLVVTVTGIAAAAALAWSRPGRWKAAALVFAVVVSFSMQAAHRLGTYDPDGRWGKLPTLVTEQRAEAINQALQRYHNQNGRYPDALADLTPRYLVYLPTPFIIPGQSWCYAGGPDYYRVGYVYRETFSSPTSVRIHAAAGEPPGSAWECRLAQ